MYQLGLDVHTTLDLNPQHAADDALLAGIKAVDERQDSAARRAASERELKALLKSSVPAADPLLPEAETDDGGRGAAGKDGRVGRRDGSLRRAGRRYALFPPPVSRGRPTPAGGPPQARCLTRRSCSTATARAGAGAQQRHAGRADLDGARDRRRARHDRRPDWSRSQFNRATRRRTGSRDVPR